MVGEGKDWYLEGIMVFDYVVVYGVFYVYLKVESKGEWWFGGFEVVFNFWLKGLDYFGSVGFEVFFLDFLKVVWIKVVILSCLFFYRIVFGLVIRIYWVGRFFRFVVF